MQYTQLATAPSLTHLVSQFWRLTNPTATHQTFTIVPDGAFEILCLQAHNQPPQVHLTAVHTHPLDLILNPYETLTGIRCRLLAADYLLDQPLPRNGYQPLSADFWNLSTLTVLPLPVLATRLTDCLLTQLAAHSPDFHKLRLFTLLHQAMGPPPVAQLAREAGWSPRHLNRYFQHQFGLSVKTFSRVVRAYAAAQQLQLHDLFPVGSYFDQSHGIRELRKYMGATPRQLQDGRFIQFHPPVE